MSAGSPVNKAKHRLFQAARLYAAAKKAAPSIDDPSILSRELYAVHVQKLATLQVAQEQVLDAAEALGTLSPPEEPA
jgi:hypothetical protein